MIAVGSAGNEESRKKKRARVSHNPHPIGHECPHPTRDHFVQLGAQRGVEHEPNAR